MSAQIHPIAAVLNGLGDATHLGVRLDHDRADISAFQQFHSGGQPGWPRTDYDGDCGSLDGCGNHDSTRRVAFEKTRWRRSR
jgi:hypothetical protein